MTAKPELVQESTGSPEWAAGLCVSASSGIREFYERYPYPRPVDDLDNYRRRWQEDNRRRADFHLFWPHQAFREDHTLLVAGCGTSQAAKHALRWPRARVVGIDLSATSIRHTEELKRKYGLANLAIHQLPIERVAELGQTFDQIVCTGVLHHLPDPAGGLRALRNVLHTDGAMHVMVYAPYGRAGIYMIQDFCRLLGLRAGDGEMENLIAALASLPPQHPLSRLLHESPDFRNEAALADALLNPQDRAYSVPQFLDFIAGAGLSFDRWLKQAAYSPQCGVLARLPQSPQLAALSAADRSAAAELFRGAMLSHSAIVFRGDRRGAASSISFDADDWPGYVPLRLPDTLCIGERLPPGAAAVLINRAHTERDIYLPIDAREKRMFDAIDGVRTIAAIAGDAPREVARRLFERLWWHDQVVFDASGPAGRN